MRPDDTSPHTRIPVVDHSNETLLRKQLIFVVEDDPDIGRLICHHLNLRGYVTRWFTETREVLAEARRTPPALFLLDVVLPGGNGFELCRQIRQSRSLSGCRIVFLTARSTEVDQVNGLELGGDAYLTKPFSPRELVARIRAILRRIPDPEPARGAKFGRIEIDPLSMTIKVDGAVIQTTIREFRLLDYLARHATRVFTRNQLLDAVWAHGAFVTQRSIDVYVRRLREKIEPDPANPVYLIAVRGVGYRFDVPREHDSHLSPEGDASLVSTPAKAS